MGRGTGDHLDIPAHDQAILGRSIGRPKPVSQAFDEVVELFERFKTVDLTRAEELLDEKLGADQPIPALRTQITWREWLAIFRRADEPKRAILDQNPESLGSILIFNIADRMRRDLEILLGDRR